ncbi:MAG TPA: hypothetical protein VGG39_24900 [Polyangiaceae bacterium]
MTAVHRRAARREEQLAGVLETERVTHRRRYQSAPDVAPIVLPSGLVVQAESKSRKTLPKWLVNAVNQTEKYSPGAIPLVALFAFGERDGLAVVRLSDLPQLLGLRDAALGEQLPLARRLP